MFSELEWLSGDELEGADAAIRKMRTETRRGPRRELALQDAESLAS